MKNSLQCLHDFGQSVWLDYISRDLLRSGELKRLIEQDDLRGLTSNPAIFEKAITGSNDYDQAIAALKATHQQDVEKIYEDLAIEDIKKAADLMHSVYLGSNKRDGYVSLEVDPHLARDTQRTIEEGKRLWQKIERANLMIKVPGTAEGMPAIRQLIRDGINVNVTLLFSIAQYQQAAEAYILGLEDRLSLGKQIGDVASVASFFISRIDSKIDLWITQKQSSSLNGCLGKSAIANAQLAYQYYKSLCDGVRWQKLAKHGAGSQRLLWASTSTKNPKYRDVAYVEELIGADTVNTMPVDTMKAFRDHGIARMTIEDSVESARIVMDTLKNGGLSFDQATTELLDEAIVLFEEPHDRLLAAIKAKLERSIA